MENPDQQSPTEPMTEHSPVPSKPSFHSKTILVTIILFGLVFVSLLTLLLGSRSKTTNQPSSTTSIPTPTGSALSPAPNGDRANWKTYTSKNNLFLFHYPVDYMLKDPGDTAVFLPGFIGTGDNLTLDNNVSIFSPCNMDLQNPERDCGGMAINVFGIAAYKNTSKWNLDTWLNKSSDAPLHWCKRRDPRAKIIPQDFRGDKALLFEYISDNTAAYGCLEKPADYHTGNGKEIIISHKNFIVFLATFTYSKKLESNFDQILSTFKFTE